MTADDPRPVAALDPLLSEEGWPYASSPPVEAGDPGRFHALFGRDSLICSLQVLPARPDVARATLRALAARQGRREQPGTLEQPGRIGHEFRDRAPDGFVAAGWPDRGAFAYYGTADATSWFLVVLAATGDRALARELEPAWRAAADWLAAALDGGGGLIRHGPGAWPALSQHGWRDTVKPTSADGGGILRPDGTAPEPPLADADSQAVAHAALRALSALDGSERWATRAAALRERLSAGFEPGPSPSPTASEPSPTASEPSPTASEPSPTASEPPTAGGAFGPDVMALEAGDYPVAGAGSQLGWLLWADALEDGARAAAADRLCEPDVLTAHGLRTLSSRSPVFAPDAYHRGSVWPFDSWLGWGGLRAAGREREAETVRRGVLAALERLGRAPELYAVTEAGEVEPIALSNRIQAWTVGARWALEHEWDGRPAAPLV